jgi:hypothetical protein
MANYKNGDVQFYNRLFRANADADGTSYIAHTDQVEGLNEAIAATEGIANTDYYITGISTEGPGFKYNSAVKFNGSTIIADTFNATSDVRLKENFSKLELEKSILDLPTYKFDFINGAKNQIGCKAQELQEICPEIVNEGSDGYLSIQESKIVYLLLDEIKKLKKEVDALKASR